MIRRQLPLVALSTSLLVVLFLLQCATVSSFHIAFQSVRCEPRCHRPSDRTCLHAAADADANDEAPEKIKGDALREKTGIRPSLHPTTINALAGALKTRATDTTSVLHKSNNAQPLDVAMAGASIASNFIVKRQENSDQDGMKLTVAEEQTIAGRVVGVLVRLEDLETTLYAKAAQVGWIDKFNEWGTFGVLKGEDALDIDDVNDKVKDDPLFAMTRAECLLGLFIDTVEIPQLQKGSNGVPDDSKIDFLDEDRREILLS
uniref:SLH domain-containing protein n=1 Tax=Craspedostauros australis TaxID=1486917 RepID=A0A7R9ZPP5_9STRA|mmetsp:Transcript_24932/g.69315  ORF Transcript_24932/g.69315 Transcript_24932/m.69315 type:complete len:260 (+) Transcript_24932:87-866(+)|eukprot:CAMPEP_0198130532 /NCGR_PEP_ID=MMETSP1442-20131203/54181_1 /TAXON_ID= /ORGANISM="Craspedostauros australis, Strain CCMP3328" /LENGTH=259 /DNA_ID=CAMNT_0043791171 /DNA_START=33 /DNA_END=815 /DNA_ORIENTATION=+